jgi:hypothetical protein
MAWSKSRGPRRSGAALVVSLQLASDRQISRHSLSSRRLVVRRRELNLYDPSPVFRDCAERSLVGWRE